MPIPEPNPWETEIVVLRIDRETAVRLAQAAGRFLISSSEMARRIIAAQLDPHHHQYESIKDADQQ